MLTPRSVLSRPRGKELWYPPEMYTARRFSILILVVAGAAFTGLAATAMVTDHDVLAGGFGLLGLLGFVLAALAPRMQGEVHAGLHGFRFELVREIVDSGERAGSPDEVVIAAIRKAIQVKQPLAGATDRGEMAETTPTGTDDRALGDGDSGAVFRGVPPTPGGAPTEQLADELLEQATRALGQKVVSTPIRRRGSGQHNGH